jgi:hypothetical protein
MHEKNSLFRKSTLNQISSPEKLNEYIKVSRPSTWIILGAVVIFAAVGIFWAVTAEIDGVRPIEFLFSRN